MLSDNPVSTGGRTGARSIGGAAARGKSAAREASG